MISENTARPGANCPESAILTDPGTCPAANSSPGPNIEHLCLLRNRPALPLVNARSGAILSAWVRRERLILRLPENIRAALEIRRHLPNDSSRLAICA